MKIDPNTGLPELPEDFAFEVYSMGIYQIYPTVAIRKVKTTRSGKRKTRSYNGDTYISHTWGPQDGESNQDNIRYLAGRLAERFYRNLKLNAETDYSGVYPPKSLNE